MPFQSWPTAAVASAVTNSDLQAMQISASPCSHVHHELYTSSNSPRRFILLGILISYLPQHHRIISRRSSEGMSPYFVLLGATSSNSAIANILSLPASHDDLSCCKEVSGFECFAGVLGIAQIGFQWASFTVM